MRRVCILLWSCATWPSACCCPPYNVRKHAHLLHGFVALLQLAAHVPQFQQPVEGSRRDTELSAPPPLACFTRVSQGLPSFLRLGEAGALELLAAIPAAHVDFCTARMPSSSCTGSTGCRSSCCASCMLELFPPALYSCSGAQTMVSQEISLTRAGGCAEGTLSLVWPERA